MAEFRRKKSPNRHGDYLTASQRGRRTVESIYQSTKYVPRLLRMKLDGPRDGMADDRRMETPGSTMATRLQSRGGSGTDRHKPNTEDSRSDDPKYDRSDEPRQGLQLDGKRSAPQGSGRLFPRDSNPSLDQRKWRERERDTESQPKNSSANTNPSRFEGSWRRTPGDPHASSYQPIWRERERERERERDNEYQPGDTSTDTSPRPHQEKWWRLTSKDPHPRLDKPMWRERERDQERKHDTEYQPGDTSANIVPHRHQEESCRRTPRDPHPRLDEPRWRERQRESRNQPRETSANMGPHGQQEVSGRNTAPRLTQSTPRERDQQRLTGKRVTNPSTSNFGHGNAPQGARMYPIGYRKLSDLSNDDTKTILYKLVCDRSGFSLLLNAVDISPDMVKLAIAVMAKACTCRTSPANVRQLLNILRTSNFLSHHVTACVTRMLTSESSSNVACIRDLLTLFGQLLVRMPSGSHVTLRPPFAAIECVVASLRERSLASSVRRPPEEDENIEAVWTEMNKIKAEMSQLNVAMTLPAHETQADYVNPAESFRTLSVCPTLADIQFRGEVFLRVNKVRGAYQDLDHYLDVQFRLLREDFMSPVRDGIREYTEAGGAVRRYNDILVYTNVHVIEPVSSNNVVALRVLFDVSRLTRINWATTKRLIYGSMVCLSKDGFQTAFFATVHYRDANKLVEGEVSLRFENVDGLPDTKREETYVMVETTAYFEAYRHILQGLQSIQEQDANETDLPFQKYVVYGEVNMQPPAYLDVKVDTTYDLSCLVNDTTTDKQEDVKQRRLRTGLDRDGYRTADEATPAAGLDPNGGQNLTAIPVLQLRQWPSNERMGLDASQLRAVQAALTREFAVIQGPPGTGKTYIGLKVVQTLLHNQHVWSTAVDDDQRKPPPILVVCLTNHALDQFLEGIHDFQKTGIVRVGGRSQSELIQSFSLEKKRRNAHIDRALPVGISGIRSQAYDDMNRLVNDIEDATFRLAFTYTNLIRAEVLRDFMHGEHFIQLGEGRCMAKWLELDVVRTSAQAKKEKAEPVEPAADVEEADEQREYNRRNAELQRRKTEACIEKQLVEEVTDIGDNDWSTPQPKKKRNIQLSDAMSEEDSMKQRNIWELPHEKRWRMYRYWITEYRCHLRKTLSESTRQHQMAADRLKEVHGQVDLLIMRQATVLGMTTTGAARNRALLQELRPRIIVVEEAAEVLESHIVTAINSSCEHLILIGDHQQLRPSPNVYTLARRYNLNISLFERMVNNGVPCETLEYQHRMRPEISVLLRHIYPNLRDDPCVLERGHVKGMSRNVFFLQHSKEEQHDNEGMSYRNKHEASFVVALCRYLLQQEHKPEDITVLTTYTGQLFELRKRMPKTDFDGVRVCCVDNYQGEENDIILLSLVRSNDEGTIGFLTDDNRVCVALSRARVGFYVIGNFEMFAVISKLWARLVESLESTGAIGETLGLYCQNHPAKERLAVSTAGGFKGAPDGGCLRPCEARLQCGHVCTLSCHPYDINHERYQCLKPCTKVLCHLGHVCPKRCHETCGNCVVPLVKVIPACGHTQNVPCHKDPATFRCLLPCERVLSCGHTCAELCGDPHTMSCRYKIQRRFPCGHVVAVQCSAGPECPQPCEAILSCDHLCSGTCSTCHRGRLHAPCSEHCGRTLVCGHSCSDVCSAVCPPCSHECENRCIHSLCNKSCGEACRPCMEPCLWRCPHYQCSKLCHELCDRPRCPHGCKKTLKCGHECIGMCGEPCPDMCRVCDYSQVCEIFFGSEDDPGARFVQLEECRHVLELEGLDTWMEQSQYPTHGVVDIQLKYCPKCKTPVRRSRRYGAIVNSTLADIEEVKRRIIGDKAKIEAAKQNVSTTMKIVMFRPSCPKLGGEITKDAQKRMKYKRLSRTALKNIKERLIDPRLSLEEATCIENITTLLYALWNLRETMSDLDDNRLVEEIDAMLRWTLTSRRRLTEQELTDMSGETRRLTLQVTAAQLTPLIRQADGDVSQLLSANFDATVRLLRSGSPLSKPQLETAESTLQEVREMVRHRPVSDADKLQVVKAVGLAKGHWFKCPNGHIYAIGECGGAMEEAKCAECQATIGGTHHALRPDNELATEMDGARHAAWSDAANLYNYQLDLDQ